MRLAKILVALAAGATAAAVPFGNSPTAAVVVDEVVLTENASSTHPVRCCGFGGSAQCVSSGTMCAMPTTAISSASRISSWMSLTFNNATGKPSYHYQPTETAGSMFELFEESKTTNGATVVETKIMHTTVVATVTLNPHTTASQNMTATPCGNETSTTLFPINVSTFNATGLVTPTTVANVTSAGAINTGQGTTATSTTTVPFTHSPSKTTGAVPSKTGSSSSVSGKTVEIGGIHVPALMLTAMVACFGFALML